MQSFFDNRRYRAGEEGGLLLPGLSLLSLAAPGSSQRRPAGEAGAAVLCAGCPERELGASTLAPSSTPMPRRSTSSPPSQPVTSASRTPAAERPTSSPLGAVGRSRRRNQLRTKSSRTTTFPPPCRKPIRLALDPPGIDSQSISPKGAATRPERIPAAIM